ncbi:MAG: hypothetical protein HWN81_03630 [Candidatus Lokiarchaeota archaeon]|nr:hypothetical protein [Candidatus Lokiarchaeota archaeon]
MNKYSFISLMITLVLLFLQFIPIGIYFQFENPFINCYERLPIQLFTFQDRQLFIWGMETSGVFQNWFEINILTGIFFLVLLPLTGILTIFGFWRENQTGKKLMNANFILLFVILLYSIIGIPIYSEEILGVQFSYFNIFLYLNYGFFILLINIIFAIIGYIKHPIQ